jgi:hypothetical protein
MAYNYMDECPDDTLCAFCGNELPFHKENREPDEDKWEWQGFCDAVCALRLRVDEMKFADDDGAGLIRKEVMRSVIEVTEAYRKEDKT